MGLGAVGRKVARVWAICGAWGTSGLPTHVDCYVYSRHGGLSFRSFDVAMGADANLLNVTHRDSAGGFAHSAPITRLILSPGTSALLLATLDSVGVCHVWKLSDTTLVHTPSSFIYLTSLPAPYKTCCVAWLAGGQCTPFSCLDQSLPLLLSTYKRFIRQAEPYLQPRKAEEWRPTPPMVPWKRRGRTHPRLLSTSQNRLGFLMGLASSNPYKSYTVSYPRAR